MKFQKLSILIASLIFNSDIYADQEGKLVEITPPKIENEDQTRISFSAVVSVNSACSPTSLFSSLSVKGSNPKLVYYEVGTPVTIKRSIAACNGVPARKVIPLKFTSHDADNIPYNSGKTYLFLIPDGVTINYGTSEIK